MDLCRTGLCKQIKNPVRFHVFLKRWLVEHNANVIMKNFASLPLIPSQISSVGGLLSSWIIMFVSNVAILLENINDILRLWKCFFLKALKSLSWDSLGTWGKNTGNICLKNRKKCRQNLLMITFLLFCLLFILCRQPVTYLQRTLGLSVCSSMAADSGIWICPLSPK
jgi:hypothetical protein